MTSDAWSNGTLKLCFAENYEKKTGGLKVHCNYVTLSGKTHLTLPIKLQVHAYIKGQY